MFLCVYGYKFEIIFAFTKASRHTLTFDVMTFQPFDVTFEASERIFFNQICNSFLLLDRTHYLASITRYSTSKISANDLKPTTSLYVKYLTFS